MSTAQEIVLPSIEAPAKRSKIRYVLWSMAAIVIGGGIAKYGYDQRIKQINLQAFLGADRNHDLMNIICVFPGDRKELFSHEVMIANSPDGDKARARVTEILGQHLGKCGPNKGLE